MENLVSRKSILYVAGALLGLATAISFPFFNKAYKSYRAETLIKETEKSISDLERKIQVSRERLAENRFLLLQVEADPYDVEITDSSNKIPELKDSLTQASDQFKSKNYDKTRKILDPKFGLKKGESRTTAKIIADSEIKDLETKVVNPLKDRRLTRDQVVRNEFYLRARLKKPLYKIEKLEELTDMPNDLYQLIPLQSEQLTETLKRISGEMLAEKTDNADIDARLNNSLGANLVSSLEEREHILEFGVRDDIKQKALEMFRKARENYLQVKPLNDGLKWYKPNKDDGITPSQETRDLRDKQNRVIEIIHSGDRELNSLHDYFDFLHQQKIVHVSEQTKKSVEFSHSRTAYKPVTRVNSKGHTYTSMQSYQQHYDTDGYKFYYTLTAEQLNPQTNLRKSDEQVYVGEKDSDHTHSYRNWDYKKDEQVGYVREYKPLHDDRAYSGMNRSQLSFRQYSDSCKTSRRK